MFYNKEKLSEFKKSQKKTDIEKIGIIVILILSYVFSGPGLAIVIGIGSIVWLLSDILKSLSYQNLMTEKKIGIHDLES
jgi:hypothetical protein